MNEPMIARVLCYQLICFIVPTTAFSQQAYRIADALRQLRQIKIEFNHEGEVPAAAFLCSHG